MADFRFTPQDIHAAYIEAVKADAAEKDKEMSPLFIPQWDDVIPLSRKLYGLMATFLNEQLAQASTPESEGAK